MNANKKIYIIVVVDKSSVCPVLFARDTMSLRKREEEEENLLIAADAVDEEVSDCHWNFIINSSLMIVSTHLLAFVSDEIKIIFQLKVYDFTTGCNMYDRRCRLIYYHWRYKTRHFRSLWKNFPHPYQEKQSIMRLNIKNMLKKYYSHANKFCIFSLINKILLTNFNLMKT